MSGIPAPARSGVLRAVTSSGAATAVEGGLITVKALGRNSLGDYAHLVLFSANHSSRRQAFDHRSFSFRTSVCKCQFVA
jgi:hypothetical protein